MTLHKIAKNSLKVSIYTILSLAAVIILANIWVVYSVADKVFDELEQVEARDVALVLGTSRSINGRDENPFFTYRIQAAAQLFFAGKVKHIIVSGDNSSQYYNEPRDMRKALIKLGVPAECITMDFAGLRTLDSVVRCKKIFQQKRFIIVSQGFHNYRALFIAQQHNIDAIAFNAKYPKSASNKVIYREYLARPKALLDIYCFDTQPKFLGDKVNIDLYPPMP
jgi:SanA protein